MPKSKSVVVKNTWQTTPKKSRTRKYAMLVVDMLNDFVYGKMRCKGAEKIIPKIKLLLKASNENNIPIYYCNDSHLPQDSYEFKLWGPHALRGTKGARVVDELKPSGSAYVVPKRTYSAFYNTKLDSFLQKEFGKSGPEAVIITGIHTNICAKHTAFDSFVRGFDVIVVEDAVAAFDDRDHKSALDYMKKNYGVRLLKTSKIITLMKK